MTTNQNPSTSTAIHQNTVNPQADFLMRKRDVAKELNVCERTVDNLKQANQIAFVRIGRAIRFEWSAVQSFKNSNRVDAV